MLLGQSSAQHDFAKWQLDVDHGKLTNDEGNITLPDYFKCSENTLDSLVDTIYPAIGDLSHPLDQYFCECMLLSA